MDEDPNTEPDPPPEYPGLSRGWVDTGGAAEAWDRDVSEDDYALPPAAVLEDAMTQLEGFDTQARMLVAAQYRVIAQVLDDAAADPELWVGPDPTADPGWVDTRERTAARVRRERRDHAVRAAAEDIAVRLRMSASTVRGKGADAGWLMERCPTLWAAFQAGAVSEQNARTAAATAASLPEGRADVWAEFDRRVSRSASILTPVKFRQRARVVRESVHPVTVDERAKVARAQHGVWVSAEYDGNAMITAITSADRAQALLCCLDRNAESLRGRDGEERTLAQLRADILTDLVTGPLTPVDDDTGKPGKPEKGKRGNAGKPAVAVTVPVLTLLGQQTEPGMLDGYGPIDTDAARRLAGEADSWVRILTHPVTGTVLDVDRTTYRVPKALRRWLGVQHPLCVFPGCRRPAVDCDADHLLEWQYGGTTADTNLAPECQNHHTIKTETTWDVRRDPVTGEIVWTSPTGHATDEDPPPW